MRLLHLDERGELAITSHDADNIPPYVILSHTWGSDADELTFQDIGNRCGQDKAGFNKVRFCGEQAKKDGHNYFWVDSCCIDKTSSSELSEAIISMFRWYKRAAICYVYLHDVLTTESEGSLEWQAKFRSSRWFTRGWTLQELLAPDVVVFFSNDWKVLGDKSTLEDLTCEITGIPLPPLRGTPLSEFHPNERLRWAVPRQTKKKEDKAYCLLGIFNVFLQPMYGEEEHAFARLEKAISKRSSQLDPDLVARCSQNAGHDVALAAAATHLAEEHRRRRRQIQERRSRLMTSLTFEQMDARRSTIRDAQRATCKWLLQHPKYRHWINLEDLESQRNILWINGKPGAGKSTLLKFICAKRSSSRKDVLLSFFFNARGGELEKTTAGMYRSLVFQLLKMVPELQSVLDEVELDNEDRSPRWTLEVMQSLFTTAVADIGQRTLTCFIDALDECNEKEVRSMVTTFEDLAESAVETGAKLRICFASRHYPEIRIKKGLSMILEKERGHSEDLRNFIRRQLDAGDGSEVERIRNKIHEKSNGVFMWAVLVVAILNGVYRSGRMWAVERKLEEIPEELSDLFRDILQRDRVHMDELLLCLQWVLFSERPLKLEEFYFAMVAGLDQSPPAAWNQRAVTRRDMTRFVVSSSKGLAELTKAENPTVQFIHESVQDFLLKEGGLSDLWPHLDGNLTTSSHEQLKNCCHAYLAVDICRLAPQDDCPTEVLKGHGARSSEDLTVAFPFLEYATQYVLPHANKAADRISQKVFLEEFPLDAWIDFANVLLRYRQRQYGSHTTLLYILAESNLPALISMMPRDGWWTRCSYEPYGYPVIAAFALGYQESLGSLCDQASPIRVEDMSRDLGFGRQDIAYDGEDPLLWAGRNKNWFLAEYILSSNLEVGVFSISSAVRQGHGLQRDVLSFAAEHGVTNLITRLLDHGANIEGPTQESQRPLVYAVESDRDAAVRLLLDKGANPNVLGQSYGSPLHVASLRGNEKVMRMLLDAGADASATGGRYGSVLQAATSTGREATVQLLIEAGAAVNGQRGASENALQEASSRGHYQIAKMLIDAGADLNAQGGVHGTALQAASHGRHLTIVELLIDAGADVNALGGKYGTALQAASFRGYEKIVQMLLEARADVNARGGHFGNALQAASHWRHTRVMNMLKDAGATDLTPTREFDRSQDDESVVASGLIKESRSNRQMSADAPVLPIRPRVKRPSRQQKKHGMKEYLTAEAWSLGSDDDISRLSS